jgi:hypothetical protein
VLLETGAATESLKRSRLQLSVKLTWRTAFPQLEMAFQSFIVGWRNPLLRCGCRACRRVTVLRGLGGVKDICGAKTTQVLVLYHRGSHSMLQSVEIGWMPSGLDA